VTNIIVIDVSFPFEGLCHLLLNLKGKTSILPSPKSISLTMKGETPLAVIIILLHLNTAYGFQHCVTQASRSRTHLHRNNHARSILHASDDNDNQNNPSESKEFQSKYIIQLDPTSEEPLFDPTERATLFGLEPKGEVDPLDNGLVVTGPIIMLGSLYVMWAMIFDVPIDL
jgi:hypothetical protein